MAFIQSFCFLSLYTFVKKYILYRLFNIAYAIYYRFTVLFHHWRIIDCASIERQKLTIIFFVKKPTEPTVLSLSLLLLNYVLFRKYITYIR